ncbi:O-antigen/teichoic acid export membrane protein [Nocardioides thalensis]|uniref:O-antigen/teichoic acid export membrane protein n=1 Tax=Nocardioides thalensis TaxID=1914755 RepID=A0A853C0G9_9ACTN|nr:oligosaccharide flippase family protein [Nocardioides thalensis]NYJ00108.1 O-antigen/teichoic acid export membrane protein [Nocardioides thalensis]
MTDAGASTAEAPAEPVTGSLVRGAGWLGAGAAIVKSAQTAVLLLLAAMLAPSAIGVLAVGALVLNVTGVITDLGSSTALVHWRGDAERAARSALTVALGLAVTITAAVWLLAPGMSHVLNTGDLGTDVIRGLILCLPFTAVSGVSQELLRRSLAFRRRVLPDMVGAVAGAVLSVSLAATGHGAFSLVYGQLMQVSLVMVLLWCMRAPVRPGWSRDDIAGLVRYGGHLAAANLLTLLMLNVDYLVVAHELGASALGAYSMAFRLAYMPYLLIGIVIGGAAFAHLCRLAGRDLARAVVDSAVVLHTLVLPLYAGIVLLAPHLGLLGEQWEPAVPALRWLALYGMTLSALHLCLVTLNAVDRTRDTFLLNAVHLVVLVGLLVAVVNDGITMVAVGQAAAAAVTLVAALAVVGRRVPGIEWGALLGRLAPAGFGVFLMAGVAVVPQVVWPDTRTSLSGLLLVGSAAAAAYAVPVVLLVPGRSAAVATAVSRVVRGRA